MEDLFVQDPRRAVGSVIVLGLALLLLMGCRTQKAGQGDGPAPSDEISVTELHDLVASGTDVYLLDVRTLPEVEAERLAFTDQTIPYDSLEAYRDRLPADRSTTIYTFCRSGRRSSIAAGTLREMGYTNVINVDGGILAWKEAGYGVVSGAWPPPDSTEQAN